MTLDDLYGKPGLYWLDEPAGRIDELTGRLWAHGRVAVLDAAACLVNNLRVWENLILPAWYHDGGALPDWEAPLSAWLDKSGLPQREGERLLGSLPSLLSLDDRRFLILLRAAVLRPDIVLVEADWLAWLRRLHEDHPARKLWQAWPCAIVVLTAHAPGDEFAPLQVCEGENGVA